MSIVYNFSKNTGAIDKTSTDNKVNGILTIKDPFTFEFPGLDAKDAVSESDLEQVLISCRVF